MGKPRYQAFIDDWADPKVVHWLDLMFEKHPEIYTGLTITPELAKQLKESGTEILVKPGIPKTPKDWEDFLPCDWDAWLCYYEFTKVIAGINITPGDIVKYLGIPLKSATGKLFIKEPSVNVVENNFKAAKKRIQELKL